MGERLSPDIQEKCEPGRLFDAGFGSAGSALRRPQYHRGQAVGVVSIAMLNDSI